MRSLPTPTILGLYDSMKVKVQKLSSIAHCDVFSIFDFYFIEFFVWYIMAIFMLNRFFINWWQKSFLCCVLCSDSPYVMKLMKLEVDLSCFRSVELSA